jgi:GGDEF domain-containing protein
MKKPTELQTRKLFVYIILLVIWSVIGAYLLVTYSPITSLLGLALNIFIIIFSLTSLFSYSSWASLIVSVALFTGAGYSLLNVNRDFLISSGIGAGIFLLTTTICEIYTHQMRKIDEKYSRLQQVTDSLVIYDRMTSLMRWKFAQQTLTSEILRGRRYQNDVSLVFFDFRQRDQFSSEEIRRTNKVIAEIVLDEIRTNLDIAFINDIIGLILPETNRSGAIILTKRLVQKFNRQVDARVVAGVANFPGDAITDEDLVERAKTALQVALNSEQSVVDFNALRGEQQSTKNQESDKTQPVEVEGEHSPRQDYVAILENIDLDDDEWIVWIQGFNQMSDLIEVKRSLEELDHAQSIEFLFLQKNHLVIKLRSTLDNIIAEPNPFPGWKVKKTSPENRYLLIEREEGNQNNDGS